MLLFMAFIVASIAFGGFFQKWNFRDGTKFSGIAMMEGTAERPFVYRQLLPAIANLVDQATPQSIKQRFTQAISHDPEKRNIIQRFFPHATDSDDTDNLWRYYTLYCLSFISMLLAIFAMRHLCMVLYSDSHAATLAAFVMALIFPILQTEGGYFYDIPELMFMALAAALAFKGRWLLLAIVTLLATFNKESFLLFVLTLFPFLRERYSLRSTILIEALLLAIAAAVNLTVKWYFADNPGEVVESQLVSHLLWLLHPGSYFEFEVNYGVPTPKGFNIIHIVIVALLVKQAWKYFRPALRQHLYIALAINIPLFLAFCYQGELRNLSMLFIGLLLMIFINISLVLQHGRLDTAPAFNGR
jgi:hypothetical protein